MTLPFDTRLPTSESNCPFCSIADTFPPFDPANPPADTELDATIEPTKTTPSTFVILSTENLVAFLDILPLSRGHLLLCPRAHRPKLTDASAQEAADLGLHLRILSKALSRATGVEDWNVVQNNGAAAAQVVMHMHYHLIPRPEIRASGRFSESFTMFGRGKREELDEEDADGLAKQIRECVSEVLREEGNTEIYGDKSKL